MFAVVIREAAKFADAVLQVFCRSSGRAGPETGGQDERSPLGSIETCSAADPYRRKTA